MATKTCSKGHKYDSTIYGNNCPFCPSSGTGTIVNDGDDGTIGNDSGGTEMNQENKTYAGPTIPLNIDQDREDRKSTIIRPLHKDWKTTSGKRIVGLLVTYDAIPTGQVFNIYEGKNTIGRNVTNDIAISQDMTVSGEHLLIAYYPANNKFYFEAVGLTSNGTYVNDKFFPKGGDELNNLDIIRIGTTQLIFIAIPQIPSIK